MNDDKSAVDRLNDTLNSRTGYVPPEDRRTGVRPQPSEEVEQNWQSPNLDDMLKDRRQPAQAPSKMKKFFLFSILVFIGAFVIAAYVYLAGGNFISTKNVDIKVTGPAALNAGEQLVLTVTVQNNNNAELSLGSLSVQYPEGTRDASDPTKALTRDRADLGTISAGEETTQTFRSVLFGQKGDVKQIKLLLQYKVAGSSATFYKDKVFEVAIGETPVAIGVSKPDSITSGETFTTRILVASNSSDIVQNVVVKAEYPYGFTALSSDPEAADKNNTWVLGDLAPGAKKTITLTGTMEGVDQDERTFRFYAGVADPGSPTQMKSPLVSTTETLAIARPSVGLSINVNGSSNQGYVAPVGEPVRVTIQYANNAPERLLNTVITARVSGASLDRSSIQLVGGFYDSNSGTITWRSSDSPMLASIAPGTGGSVSFSFASIKNPAPGSQLITIDATLAGSNAGSPDPVRAAAKNTVKIASQVSLTGKTLYARGPFKNSGPIPPKVGKETTYTAVIDLANTQNDVTNARVTAKLGPNVKWLSGPTGSEDITYDESTNSISWNVGTLESGTGFSKPVREAVFQVAITPSIGQIGTVPTLVSGIVFAGTDSFTGENISVQMQGLTTRNSTESSYTQGNEVVVK